MFPNNKSFTKFKVCLLYFVMNMAIVREKARSSSEKGEMAAAVKGEMVRFDQRGDEGGMGAELGFYKSG